MWTWKSRAFIFLGFLVCFSSAYFLPQVVAEMQASGDLLFRSNFAPGVKIEPPFVDGRQWWQRISGSSDGHSWDTDLPARGENSRFQYLVPKEENPDDYVSTRIEKVVGPKGGETNALRIETKRSHPTGFGLGWLPRVQYNLLWDGSIEQAYVRYYLKLQPDLETLMPPGLSAWRNLMEWRESGVPSDDFRWSLYVFRNPNVPQLFWQIEAEYLLPEKKIVKRLKNTDVPVPIGEWFLLEVFFRYSTSDDGRMWVAINGETIADYRGQTKKDSNLSKWNIFKAYTGKESLARGPAYQWITDFEIHTDILEPVDSLSEFHLSVSKDINLIHVPLKVVAVDDRSMTIRTIGDLYDVLGGQDNVSFIITYQPSNRASPGVWRSYLGDISRGSPADQKITDEMGMITVMKHPVTLRLKGEILGVNGLNHIHISQGTNLIGVPLMDDSLKRVSDLLSLEGIRNNATAIIVLDSDTFKIITRPGDDGDIPITGGQSFIIIAFTDGVADVRGQAWDNVSSGTPTN